MHSLPRHRPGVREVKDGAHLIAAWLVERGERWRGVCCDFGTEMVVLDPVVFSKMAASRCRPRVLGAVTAGSVDKG